MVIGSSDSGKTSLVAKIVSYLREQRIAIIDSDIGQSHIGPPTTVAWGKIARPFDWEKINCQEMFFVGFTSPVRDLPSVLTATKLADQSANCWAEKLIIDTCGLVFGPGLILKRSKIALLKPDLLIILGSDMETNKLANLLSPFIASEKLYLLPNSKKNQVKTAAERAIYREKQFARYFQLARKHRFSFSDIGLTSNNRSLPEGLLVSLSDPLGRDVALGLILDQNQQWKTVTILSPLRKGTPISKLKFGSICLDRSGKQLSSSSLRFRENKSEKYPQEK